MAGNAKALNIGTRVLGILKVTKAAKGLKWNNKKLQKRSKQK
ncbi:hypothetical protein [Candidatus Ruthturnera calyptogenae]|nr:hypothetical protein [Candidatus Ruthturnera calyptogenae]